MAKYDLVIFDLDGTLIDTITDLGTAVNHALSLKGFAQHSMKEYAAMVGHGIRNLVTVAMPEAFRTELMIDECLAEFVSYYKSHIDVHTRPYKGIQKLVSELYASGVKVAVASNKFQEGTEMLVKEFFGDVPFVAVCGNKEGAPLKPDPQLVRGIVELADIGDAGKVVMVGDSGADVKTAINAGIDGIAVTWGFRSRAELVDAGAVVFADSVSELRDLLLK